LSVVREDLREQVVSQDDRKLASLEKKAELGDEAITALSAEQRAARMRELFGMS
jgi:hypothetical protein